MIKILKEELAETRGFLKNTPRKNEQMVSYLQGKMDGLAFAIKVLEKGANKMKEKEDIKQRIDDAEKELRELFYDLIYDHCDNEGQYELNNLASGFNTLLRYAREWQKMNEEGK